MWETQFNSLMPHVSSSTTRGHSWAQSKEYGAEGKEEGGRVGGREGGKESVMLKAYSWICAPGSFLVELRGPYGGTRNQIYNVQGKSPTHCTISIDSKNFLKGKNLSNNNSQLVESLQGWIPFQQYSALYYYYPHFMELSQEKYLSSYPLSEKVKQGSTIERG